MTIFDPTYGELFTAREVVALTGLTMNQLRNWRLPARSDSAPFGYVAIGMSPHYRKIVVETWLERNGGNNRKFVPLGIDSEFPISETLETDNKRREASSALLHIQPENVLSVFERLLKQDNKTTFRYANTERMRLIKLELPEWNPLERQINSDTRFSEPIWFPTMVKAMRLAQNEMAGLGFTEEEVLEMPIGNYPPLKETKG